MATDKRCTLTNGHCNDADCVGDGKEKQCGVNYTAGRCDPCIHGTWAPEQTNPDSGGKYGNGYHCLLGKTADVNVKCPTKVDDDDTEAQCFDHTDGNKYYYTGSNTKVAQQCWQDADCGDKVSCLPINDEGSHIGKTCEELLSEYSKDRVNCKSGFTLGIKGTGRILPDGDSKTAPGPCQFECKKTPAAPEPSPPPTNRGKPGPKRYLDFGGIGPWAPYGYDQKTGKPNTHDVMANYVWNGEKWLPPPTPTPTPGPEPGPTPGPSPSPEPGPTPGPEPGPTPGPSPSPEPGPTPGPSSTSPKNNKVLIIALVVLGLLTIGGGGFLIYRGYKK